MKDTIARSDIVRLKWQVEQLQTANTNLTKAFDAFFDIVAEDLGYEAAKGTMASGYHTFFGTLSPRQCKKTESVSEVIRKPTARCKTSGRI